MNILFFGLIILLLIFYFIYCIVLSHFAIDKINRSIFNIEDLLGVKIYEVYDYDYTPLKVQYTILENAHCGLPSRKFLRKIKKIKKGNYSLDKLNNDCFLAEQKYLINSKNSKEI